MLQNRVDPAGRIVAVAARGALMGNRGILHRPNRTLGTARWRTKAWICCVLLFKDRRRTVMAPGAYTELFFLDEATALAAGHRPCAECRRADFRRFQAAWAQGLGLPGPVRATAIDERLHAERVDPAGGGKRTVEAVPVGLPPGVMVREPDGRILLVGEAWLRPWSFTGYGPVCGAPDRRRVELLTPPAIVAALRAGYRPLLHPSAGA